MLVIARIVGFLLLFALVTQTLSIALSHQGRDNYAAGKCNVVVSERKAKRATIENANLGRKMLCEYNVAKKEKKKEMDEKYTRKSRMLIKSRESYEARLVAFNADYKGPRHHPPKNN